jgi:hypothetical protein
MMGSVGTAWPTTPFDAVRNAAFEALRRIEVVGEAVLDG